ncbi:MAG: HAD hydrolase family protein [Thermoplasmata archaeon]|nr:HAD hydrolase family protein [Thermoplasmata archaeon]
MDEFPYRLVSVDIDGTLTLVHGWEVIASRLGRSEGYDQTERLYRAGTIGEDEHLRNLLALAEGATMAELDAILAGTPRVEAIDSAVERLHAYGCRVALLTHNPPYVTDWYCRTFGFDAADGLASAPTCAGGRVEAPVGTRADKVGGLDRLCRRFSVPRGRVAHVGDGLADAEVFPLVGFGVAFRSRIPEVRAAADAVLDSPDLPAVVDLLRRSPSARP